MVVLVLPSSCNQADNPRVSDEIVASFSISDRRYTVGEEIHFENTSMANGEITYLWDFGDGSVSTEQSPVHSYERIGQYLVNLSITNQSTEDDYSIQLTISYSNEIDERESLLKRLEKDKIMIVAHRGCHTNQPENSVLSVLRAIENGVEMVELDVRTTKEGELILMHDVTVDRTTNGSGRVEDLTLEQLKALKLLDESGRETDQGIPTLEGILNITRGKVYIDFDLKGATFNNVFRQVDMYGMTKQVLFYLTSKTEIVQATDRSQDVVVMPILRSEEDLDLFKTIGGIQVIQYNGNNNAYLQAIENESWYYFRNAYVNVDIRPSSDNYKEVDRSRSLGAKLIQTDYPLEIKHYLNNN